MERKAKRERWEARRGREGEHLARYVERVGEYGRREDYFGGLRPEPVRLRSAQYAGRRVG